MKRILKMLGKGILCAGAVVCTLLMIAFPVFVIWYQQPQSFTRDCQLNDVMDETSRPVQVRLEYERMYRVFRPDYFSGTLYMGEKPTYTWNYRPYHPIGQLKDGLREKLGDEPQELYFGRLEQKDSILPYTVDQTEVHLAKDGSLYIHRYTEDSYYAVYCGPAGSYEEAAGVYDRNFKDSFFH